MEKWHTRQENIMTYQTQQMKLTREQYKSEMIQPKNTTSKALDKNPTRVHKNEIKKVI